MFARKIAVRQGKADGTAIPCPIAWIDNFAMRNFTNDAVFDDTLPVADGLLEIGARVPLDRLRSAMEDWFRRKGYLKAEERLELEEQRAESNADSWG
ncbi:hypothetical protein ACOBR2_18110 [Telmatobacter bradus]|uniref:hypothetical protein n=1 Tax=Telmatobacter bradus TaxID=474953 RepID=UPI003B43216C